MIHKRLGGAALLSVLLTFPASASMVSFLLVETGLSEGAQSSQYSSVWEGGLMDVFFNAGHIVTNLPIARMEKKPAQELSGQVEGDFHEAVYGGADYFVVGFLEYQNQGPRTAPTSISLKLYSAATGNLVFEQGFPAGTGRNLDDEYRLAQNAGRVIVSHLQER
jgi:hypothetical protein